MRARAVLFPIRWFFALGFLGVLPPLAARADDAQTTQPASQPADERRGGLERLALLKARGALFEQILLLPLKEELAVDAWTARNLDLERELRAWVGLQPRHGPARFYSDGACEVDLRLEPTTLRQHLAALGRKYRLLDGDPLRESDLEAAAHTWPVLWSTATAGADELRRTNAMIGWEDVTPEGVELARRAAMADAIHALLEKAGGHKISSARRLREFLDCSDAVRENVRRAVAQAAALEVQFAPDQVATSKAALPLAELIRILVETQRTHYQGEEFRTVDFREMSLFLEPGELTATGLAVPPTRCLVHWRPETPATDGPAWRGLRLDAVGRYEAAETQEKIEVARRVELARLAAIDDLRQQVDLLALPNGEPARTVLAAQPELENDLSIYLNGARIVQQTEPDADGSLEIRVELPLHRLWTLLRPFVPAKSATGNDATNRPAPVTITSQPAARDAVHPVPNTQPVAPPREEERRGERNP